MALITNNGLPGAGKTEYLTYMALKHYKRTNNIIAQTIRRIMKRPLIINNIYTDYPVCLDLKKQIYSRIVSINDLDNSWSFLPNSFIGIDEPQLDYDSLDFKEFPRGISMFLQAHRHFDISDVVFATQHPNRLVVYEKNIMSIYNRIFTTFKIPFTPYKLVVIRNCYELIDYDYISARDKETRRSHDIRRHFKIYNAKKVHQHYNDKYLAPLNRDKPLLDKGYYRSLEMTEEQKIEYLKRFDQNSVKATLSRTGGKSSAKTLNFSSKNKEFDIFKNL